MGILLPTLKWKQRSQDLMNRILMFWWIRVMANRTKMVVWILMHFIKKMTTKWPMDCHLLIVNIFNLTLKELITQTSLLKTKTIKSMASNQRESTKIYLTRSLIWWECKVWWTQIRGRCFWIMVLTISRTQFGRTSWAVKFNYHAQWIPMVLKPLLIKMWTNWVPSSWELRREIFTRHGRQVVDRKLRAIKVRSRGRRKCLKLGCVDLRISCCSN